MTQLTVVPCGTKVSSILGNVEGIITAISIRFNRASYEVSYFAGHDYKQIWMDEQEFKYTTKKETIGFKKT